MEPESTGGETKSRRVEHFGELFDAVRLTKNTAILRTFEGIVETDDGYRFTGQFKTDKSGTAHCVKLSVEQSGPDPVVAMIFRQHSLRDILDQMRQQGIVPWRIKRSDGVVSVAPANEVTSAEVRSALSKLRRPLSGSALDQDHLKAIAQVFEAASGEGLQPAKVISNETGSSLATAYRWIKRAKQAGFIKD